MSFSVGLLCIRLVCDSTYDTFAILDASSNIHTAFQVVFALLDNCKFNLTVINEQVMTNFRGLDDLWMRELDAGVVTLCVVKIQAESLALFKKFSVGAGEFTKLLEKKEHEDP